MIARANDLRRSQGSKGSRSSRSPRGPRGPGSSDPRTPWTFRTLDRVDLIGRQWNRGFRRIRRLGDRWACRPLRPPSPSWCCSSCWACCARRPGWRRRRRSSRRWSSRSPSTGCRCSSPCSSTIYGAAYGIFPIAWIVFTSILLYRLAVDTGKFEIIKDSVGGLTSDRRLQAMFIAFSFGAFIEGAAGFGAPVAVSGAMLGGPRLRPVLRRRHLSAGEHGAGRVRIHRHPVTTLANVTGLPVAGPERDGRAAVRDDLRSSSPAT